MSRRNLIAVIGLILLIAVSGWLQGLLNPEEDDGPPPAVRHEVDYYLEHFVATTMGPTGKPRHRLESAMMAHYPDDDELVFRHRFAGIRSIGEASIAAAPLHKKERHLKRLRSIYQ